MNYKTQLMLFASVGALFAGSAQAAITASDVAQTYVDQGYSFVEVKDGPTQIKVEATRGSEKIEVVYDKETAQVLSSEVEPADEDDVGRSGVEIESEDEDFTEADDEEADDDEADDDETNDDEGDDDNDASDEGDDDEGDDD